MALEAKACMTAHQRALPRLYDELNSSHLTVHGATDQAIAAGFAMVNIAGQYLSPDLNKKNRSTDPQWSLHTTNREMRSSQLRRSGSFRGGLAPEIPDTTLSRSLSSIARTTVRP